MKSVMILIVVIFLFSCVYEPTHIEPNPRFTVIESGFMDIYGHNKWEIIIDTETGHKYLGIHSGTHGYGVTELQLSEPEN